MCCYAECNIFHSYAECRCAGCQNAKCKCTGSRNVSLVLSVIMLGVIMLGVIMLGVIMLNAKMLIMGVVTLFLC